MKNLFALFALLLVVFLLTGSANAQLSVTVTNNTNTTPNLAASYASFAAALADLNSVTAMTGPVTLTLQAGSETSPIKGFVLGSASLNPVLSATNTITINTSGSVTINANVGTSNGPSAVPDGMLILNGADYVTIDGITFTDGNSASALVAMEFGIALFKRAASDGCNNNTIQNCTLNMQRVNNATGSGPLVEGSVGIGVYNSTYTAATTALTPTNGGTLATNGTNSANRFYSNIINSGNYGIALYGYAATLGVGPTPTATSFLGDLGNIIGASGLGNQILNYGGGATTSPAAGIRANYQWGVNISYNIINNNNGGGVNHATTLRGIYAQAGTSANATITFNNVTIHGGATTSAVSAIENAIGSTAASNTVDITNNTITGDYLTATSGTFYLIYNTSSAETVNINNNTIQNTNYSDAALTGTGVNYPIYSSGSATNVNANYNTINNIARAGSSTSGTLIGIYLSSGTNQTATNNNISNLSISGTSTGGTIYGIQTTTSTLVVNNNNISNLINNKTTGTGSIYGIYNGGSPTNENINNNTVYNLTHSGTGTVYGIYMFTTTGTRTMSGNTVYGLSTAGTTIAGIYNASSSPDVYKNKVYNIQSTSSGNAIVSGILQGSLGTGGNANIYNNYIGDLKAPNGTISAVTAPSVRGINITTTTTNSTLNVHYNTVYINASSVAANFGSAGLYVSGSATSTTANLSLRNNLIVNNSTPAGTGYSVAYQRSSVELGNYNSVSNYNLFYAGTPGTSNLLFFDGTNSEQTLAGLKARVTPRDANSVRENPNFVSTTGSDGTYLHINTGIATQIESGGNNIATYTDDYDGNVRQGNPGYVGTGTAPDIGADEFEGIPTDLNGPSITYTLLSNSALTTGRVFSNVSITDPSGVNVDPGTKPRVYYKKSTDANTYVGNTNADDGWKWVETSSGSTPFSFTLDYSLLTGGGISAGEIVQYFAIAQDLLGNVSINSGTPAQPLTSVDLTDAEFPLTGTINSYTISSAITGEVLVGTGQTYTSLTADAPTGLFKAINERVVTGNLTVKITSDLTETGAVALNQTVEELLYTITIQPNDASLKTISGTYAGGLIRLNGADRITFDGRFSGSGNYLTFSNTNTSTNTAVFHLISLGTGSGAANNTIRNCNIVGGANNVTSIFGIFVGGATISTSGTGADNDNLTVQSNNISKAYYGIYARGVSISGELDGLNISENIIGSSSATDYITGYGISLAGMTGANIAGNEVYNLIYDGSKYGVYLNTYVSNSVFSKNKIHTFNQSNTTTSYYVSGIYFASATGNSNNQIDNNIIYDLQNYGSTIDYYLTGIRLMGGDGYKIYYNTISQTGSFVSTSSGLYAISLAITTAATNVDLRNNVFYNSKTGTTPKSYTIYAVTGTTFTNLNYNDYYTTGAAFGYYGAVEVATFAAWKTASGEGDNSINSDPLLNSETNLKPQPNSPAIAAGTPIAGITTDIIAAPRSGTAPSMGAYEQGVDLKGPIITYTPLVNTASTANRVLSTTITDYSGVPTSGTGLPVLYWKINAGSYTAVTGAFVSGNEYTFTFGSGVVLNDVISYYIVAQDLAVPPNLSAQPSTGASGFTSDPPAVSTPPTTPSSYTITPTVGGTFTVGTGGDYPTLTGAGGLFSAINSSVLTSSLTINVLTDITEDGTNALNQWIEEGGSGYTMTIQPADGTEKVISGAVANGMIRFNGADRVTVDGRFSGAGMYLRFRNTNTSNSTFTFINDAANNTIRNCYIEGSSTSTSNGIIFFSTGSATGNDNNTITQNVIRDRSDALAVPYYAIYSSGSAAAFKQGIGNDRKGDLSVNKVSRVKETAIRNNKDLKTVRSNALIDVAEDVSDEPILSDEVKLFGPEAEVNNSGNIITNNEIFNFRSYGVYVTATGNGDGWNIGNNSFYNNLGTPPSVTQTVIYFIPGTNSSGNTISGNFIGGSSANCGGTPWTNSGGVAYYGMQIAVGTTSATTVSGNTISNISQTSTGSASLKGIYVTAGTVNISTNTIGHSTNPNSIQNAGTGLCYGIHTNDALVNITNNEIANLTTGTGSIFGIYRGYTTTSIDGCTVNSNNIHDLTTSSVSTGLSTSMAACGIVYFPNTYMANDVVNGNTIYNIHASSTTAVSTAAAGILASNNSAKFTANKIYNILNSSTGTTLTAPPIAAGLINRYADNNLFANNLISLGTGQTTNTQFNGILLPASGNSGSFNALYNTIYIGGTIAAGDIPSFGLLRGDNTGPANLITVNIDNNVIYNERTGGTAKQYALANQCTVLDATGWGANASDYNLLVTPNASILNLWGPTDYNFADWKTNSSCDIHSISDLNSNVPSANLFTAAATGDLSVKTGEAICWIINGKGIPITAVNNDYAGNSRSTAAANGPTDVGAYEFTPSVAPSPATPSGSPAPSSTTTYSQNNQQLGSILWGVAGTPPASISFSLYTGTQPSGGGAVPKAYMYWVITPTGGDGYSYDITLYYDENELGGIPEDKLHPAKSTDNGVTWQAYLTEGTGPEQFQRYTANNTITIYGLTSFSWFGLGNTDSPLPVVLSSFSSSVNSRDVKLTWKTESEMNNAGFDVERSVSGLNQWVKAGYIAGKGNSTSPVSYSFEDKKLNSGKYNYRLKQIDNNGHFEYYDLSNVVEVGLPTKFDLSQNYPNPFNPTTKIDFSLPLDAKVSIKLYDITGREIKTLVNDSRTAGYYTVQFNASDLSSGTYFYRIMTKSSAADYIMTKKMMLVK